MAGIKIIGLGKARGDRVVTNEDLEQIVDTSDGWIREKSGIRSRYFAEHKTNADLASEAAEAAILSAGIDPARIGVVLVCTFTGDDLTPATACQVCGRLKLSEEVLALDINGACAGFIYGCNIANGLLSVNGAGDGGKYALVIGSEKISPLLDMEDRATCVLFGDGAGAAVLEYDEEAEFYFYGGCQPNRQVLGCSREKAAIEMAGQEVYRFAVSKVPACIHRVLELAGRTGEETDYFVCHQANERIIDAAARRITKEKQKFYKNLYQYGNTSAASIPLALCEMGEEGLLRKGSSLVCTGFGAGLTYGCMWITAGRDFGERK